MNIKKYTHIIFDLDQTIAELDIDWLPWIAALKKIINKYDPTYMEDGKFSQDRVNIAMRAHGDKLRKEILKFNEIYEGDALIGFIPVKKTLDLIKKLDASQKAYVLTSNSRKTALPILNYLEITKRFKKIVTRDDVEFIKPDPQPFELIREKDVPLKNYLMIGDSEADKNFAAHAGIDFVNVDEL